MISKRWFDSTWNCFNCFLFLDQSLAGDTFSTLGCSSEFMYKIVADFQHIYLSIFKCKRPIERNTMIGLCLNFLLSKWTINFSFTCLFAKWKTCISALEGFGNSLHFWKAVFRSFHWIASTRSSTKRNYLLEISSLEVCSLFLPLGLLAMQMNKDSAVT